MVNHLSIDIMNKDIERLIYIFSRDANKLLNSFRNKFDKLEDVLENKAFDFESFDKNYDEMLHIFKQIDILQNRANNLKTKVCNF